MVRLGVTFAFVAALAACSVVDTLVDGFKHARAVESDLEASVGTKPQVGFNWHNGRLRQVTVTFPRILEAKPVREVAETVRTSVEKEFARKPDDIVLAFSLGKSASGQSAEAR